MKSLDNQYPEIAKEWNDNKNGTLNPTDVTPFSNKKVWWKCKSGHSWLASGGFAKTVILG